MRLIDTIIIHCSATKPSQDIGAEEIDEWHRKRSWNGIGYHAVIRRDGTIEEGRKPFLQGAHAKGRNVNSLGVCLIGGITEEGLAENNFTEEQFDSLYKWINTAQYWFGPLLVIGHTDIPGVIKNCPCFNVSDWLRNYNA